jgi:hypothetical protein
MLADDFVLGVPHRIAEIGVCIDDRAIQFEFDDGLRFSQCCQRRRSSVILPIEHGSLRFFNSAVNTRPKGIGT